VRSLKLSRAPPTQPSAASRHSTDTSEATAYVVDDYPYGFHERTQIRYWLEHKPKKGWRFVSQTLNPKTSRWNKPKTSTYTEWGAAMYLDEKGHVQWTGVGPYTDEQQFLSFVTTFPDADMRELRKVVPAKIRYVQGRLSGAFVWKVNDVTQPLTDADRDRLHRELTTWEEISALLGSA
jgi:hypothetical protein